MALVISRLCRDCVDGACTTVCPTDCIWEHRPEGRASELPNQLFIFPDDCVDCGACIPECPWEAIYFEDEVPNAFREDVALNARTAAHPEEYAVAGDREAAIPAAAAVEANKVRWGLRKAS